MPTPTCMCGRCPPFLFESDECQRLSVDVFTDIYPRVQPCTLYPLPPAVLPCASAAALGVNVSAPFSAGRLFTWRALAWGWLHAPFKFVRARVLTSACCRPDSAERAPP
eukprot:6827075-Prymnesium_polylepis.1